MQSTNLVTAPLTAIFVKNNNKTHKKHLPWEHYECALFARYYGNIAALLR